MNPSTLLAPATARSSSSSSSFGGGGGGCCGSLRRWLVHERGIDGRTLKLYLYLVVLYTLNMMGFLITMPLMIFAQTKFFNNNEPCVTDEETASAGCVAAMSSNAAMASWTGLLASVLSFALSPVIGRISDSIGRRRCIVASMVPMVVRQVVLFLWAATDGQVSLYPYLVFAGVPDFVWILGNAYVADIIPPASRAAFFAFNAALVSGNQIWGAALADRFDSMVVTSAIALVSRGLCLLMAIFILPETLPTAARKPLRNVSELREAMNTFSQIKILNRSSTFRRLSATLFASALVSNGMWQVGSMFLRQELDFSKHEFAVLGEISGAGGLLANAVIAPIMIARCGEKRTLIAGLIGYVCYLWAYAGGWVDTASTAYVASLIQDIANVAYPAISSIKSTLCAGNEQGQILGAISAVQALAAGVGPFLFNGMFSLSIDADFKQEMLSTHGWSIEPRDVYWVAIAVMAIGVLLALTVVLEPTSHHVDGEDKLDNHRMTRLEDDEDEVDDEEKGGEEQDAEKEEEEEEEEDWHDDDEFVVANPWALLERETEAETDECN
jgi:DHA1 family tetracycline resistance protein-like MFS transporter